MKTITVKGFSSTITSDPTLAVAVYGGEGSGKTEFSCTAPGVIGFIPLERKCRQTVYTARKKYGKTILLPDKDFIRVTNPIALANLGPDKCSNPSRLTPPMCCAPHYYRAHVDSVKSALMDLYFTPGVDSLVIDSGTQLWEDMLMAHYGRTNRIMPLDRKPCNQEMIDLLNSLSGKNLVITHRTAQVWKGNNPTDKVKLDGFGKIGFFVSAVVRCVNDEDKEEGEDGWFYMDIDMCQAKPSIAKTAGKKALEDGGMTFANLAMLIFPDSDPEKWI